MNKQKEANNTQRKIKKGKDGRPRLITEGGHLSSVENIELYPNCSEMVFRLTGSIEEIRKQMYNIIEWTRKEYTGEIDGAKQKLASHIAKGVKDIKDKIKNAKTLEDFEQIVIEFTCNYETFFKKDEDDSLLVATCNNYKWDDVDKEEVYQESGDREGGYYNVAGYEYYIKAGEIEGYEVYKIQYENENKKNKKTPKFVFPEKGFKPVFEEYHTPKDAIKLAIRGNIVFQINNNKLEKIQEVKDETMLNKLKILMNLEDSKNK